MKLSLGWCKKNKNKKTTLLKPVVLTFLYLFVIKFRFYEIYEIFLVLVCHCHIAICSSVLVTVTPPPPPPPANSVKDPVSGTVITICFSIFSLYLIILLRAVSQEHNRQSKCLSVSIQRVTMPKHCQISKL